MCWIWSGLGNATGDVPSVPVLEPPPTPTPQPSPTLTATPPATSVRFALTIVNNSGVNLCFLFIVPSNQIGWGNSVLPGNAYLPQDGKIVYLLPGGNYNLRAEDCKDDVVEVLVDLAFTKDTQWVVGN